MPWNVSLPGSETRSAWTTLPGKGSGRQKNAFLTQAAKAPLMVSPLLLTVDFAVRPERLSLARRRGLPNAPHDRLLNACFALECILAGERNALRLDDASPQGIWSAKKCVLDAGGQSSAYGQPSPADGGSCRWAVLSARCGLRLLQTSLMAGLCFFPCVSLSGSVK